MSHLTNSRSTPGAFGRRRDLHLVSKQSEAPKSKESQHHERAKSKGRGRRGARFAPGRLPLEIPEDYRARLEDGRDGNSLLRLTLRGTTRGFPFLAELYRRHQVETKIVQVWLEFDEGGSQYGQMLIEVTTELGKSTYDFFGTLGIAVETLGCLRPA